MGRFAPPVLPVLGGATLPASDEVIIPLIIKTDVTGSIAAVEHELVKLKISEVKLKVVATGTGAITETDIKMAAASDRSIILGFNVKATKAALELAEHQQVKIATFDIIYKLSEWLAEEIKQRTPLHQVEVVLGQAKVLKLFGGTKNKQVIGGRVLEGKLAAGKTVKIVRRGAELGEGRIAELQQQKLKIKEVESGSQFGALVEARTVIAPGDTLVAYDIVNQ